MSILSWNASVGQTVSKESGLTTDSFIHYETFTTLFITCIIVKDFAVSFFFFKRQMSWVVISKLDQIT